MVRRLARPGVTPGSALTNSTCIPEPAFQVFLLRGLRPHGLCVQVQSHQCRNLTETPSGSHCENREGKGLWGRRFPPLLAATGSQTAVLGLE